MSISDEIVPLIPVAYYFPEIKYVFNFWFVCCFDSVKLETTLWNDYNLCNFVLENAQYYFFE